MRLVNCRVLPPYWGGGLGHHPTFRLADSLFTQEAEMTNGRRAQGDRHAAGRGGRGEPAPPGSAPQVLRIQ